MIATSKDNWLDSATIAPVAPSLGQHVVDQLRRLIINGELAPGTHLVEAQLSDAFKVSRGPVRDALRQLETEGLVASRRRGMFVIGLRTTDLEELYILRTLLEVQAVKLCMANESTDYRIAHQAIDRMKIAAQRHAPDEFATADLDFHTAFYALAHHRRLEAIWHQYRPTFADMLSVTNAQDRDLFPTLQDHIELLSAVESREYDRAESILREHMDGSHRRMLSAYASLVPFSSEPPSVED